MSRENLLILLGVLILVSPFVGLPLFWLSFILPVLGALVVLIGITLRTHRSARSLSREQEPHDPSTSA